MSPTPRAAVALGLIALGSLLVPLGLVGLAAAALVTAMVADAWSVRAQPEVRRELPPILSRGVPVSMPIDVRAPAAGRVAVLQGAPGGLVLEPDHGSGTVLTTVQARVRGRHVLPQLGVRTEGRLGLGAWYHRSAGEAATSVYPDLVAARRLATAARQGRLSDPRQRSRGPLGLGTDFESVREWGPDDDVRHINWAATQRSGRLMSNQYRLEPSRPVTFMIDAGRLMASPLGDRTRLDAAMDALAAVAMTADALGDHCGAIAFDRTVRARLAPRPGGGRGVVRALFDLQPRAVESDYARAFRTVTGGKRTLVLLFTDLFDEAAARALVDAVPVLCRHHVVLVASVRDPDLDAFVRTAPRAPVNVYAAATALELEDSRARACAQLARAGAQVVQDEPAALSTACVRAYLSAKATLRL